jgi:hypothetical protein
MPKILSELPGKPAFWKKPVFRTFPAKTFIIFKNSLMLFRTLPVAPDCNKVSENEKTSGNRYKPPFLVGTE